MREIEQILKVVSCVVCLLCVVLKHDGRAVVVCGVCLLVFRVHKLFGCTKRGRAIGVALKHNRANTAGVVCRLRCGLVHEMDWMD